jgi:cobalt/nickel transport system permease protein
MSHLHIPDGILPPVLWVSGLVVTLMLLLWSASGRARGDARGLAFQSSLGGIMLAVMALPVPFTALDYCMTLAGPVGVLLGAAGAFQVSFVVTLILALLGQGGFTVIGLNAFVLGAGAMIARPVYVRLVGALGPPRAMAAATAVSQLLSTATWILLLIASVNLTPEAAGEREISETLLRFWHGTAAAIVVPLLLLAVALESFLGYGLAHFLARVRPDLLPTVPLPGAASTGPSAPHSA